VQPSATSDRALVKRLGQQFESARRLFIFPAIPIQTKSRRCWCRGLCQQYVSSRLCPKASSLALACYKCLQDTAGGGASSSVDRLTDVPEFRRVWHRRKGFARVPRRRRCVLGTSPVRCSANFACVVFSEVRAAPIQHLSPAHSEYMLYLLHNGVGTPYFTSSVHPTWCGAG
jgi:hypothetical protein